MMSKRSRWMIASGVLLATLIILFARIDSVRATFDLMHAVRVYLRAEAELMPSTPAGRYYAGLYYKHLPELFKLIDVRPEHNEQLVQAFVLFAPELEALLDGDGDNVHISARHVATLQAELDWYASMGSPSLQEDIQKERERLQLDQFVGMTMTEAWEYINSKWTPEMVVQPAPTSVPITPTSLGSEQPKLVKDQNIVPGSDGKWAYYVRDGVYLEYPASYYVYLGVNSILFASSTNLENWNDPSSIMVDIWTFPVDRKDTLKPDYWFSNSPGNIVWQQARLSGEFEGTEYILSIQIGENDPVLTLGSMLYNQENQLALHIQVVGIPPSSKDFALLSQEYEYFQHMVENLRMQTP